MFRPRGREGVRRIDQVLAGFADGDAISHAARQLRSVFRGWGCGSDIYAPAQSVSPALRRECMDLAAFKPDPADICIHHYGIHSEAADAFGKCRCRKVLLYHNVTPARFFRGYDDALAARLDQARALLPALAGSCAAVWAASRFNAQDLADMGVAGASVFPLPFDPGPLDVKPEPVVAARLGGPLTNILFVGRIAPNKRIEDLILAFAWYNKALDPFSRLVLVGSSRSAPSYFAMLRMLAVELDLPNVCFEDFASQPGLAACYESARVFVSASEHEGYCLPLVEAMYKGVPVIARASGGMPEALGGAGALYEGLTPPELAALIRRVARETPLRAEMLAAQRTRVAEILARDVAAELRSLIDPLAR